MESKNIVNGFKVFNKDWTCRDKQYTCPGKFEENGVLEVCGHGMHFCETAANCFNYYNFNSENKVAEVIAHGEVIKNGNKSCTDKLEIVREIPWDELLRIVNIGKECTGLCNTGNRNTGDCNTGDWNTGDCNTGDWNTGDWNTGDWNTGDCNTGIATPGIGTPGIGTNLLSILVVSILKSKKSSCSINRLNGLMMIGTVLVQDAY
jgi:hypothetical protein